MCAAHVCTVYIWCIFFSTYDYIILPPVRRLWYGGASVQQQETTARTRIFGDRPHARPASFRSYIVVIRSELHSLHPRPPAAIECDLWPVDCVCRITPIEWNDPQPWKDGDNDLETRLNVANLIWFSCGTMLQQGSDISPM